MSDLNQCQFIGRLGRDPETRYLPNGDAVTNFSIAVSERWKDKSGEKQERTEWVRCSTFGKLAEIAGKYLVKGKQCYVSGKMQTREYEKDGQKHYSTEVRVDTLQLLGGNEQRGEPAKTHGQMRQESKARTTGFDDMDDDIPF